MDKFVLRERAFETHIRSGAGHAQVVGAARTADRFDGQCKTQFLQYCQNFADSQVADQPAFQKIQGLAGNACDFRHLSLSQVARAAGISYRVAEFMYSHTFLLHVRYK